MLVLSRRPKQRILFPELGITVEVVQAGRKVVRLGIVAPPSVSVVREEITSKRGKEQARPGAEHRHRLRNSLNTATRAVHLAQKQVSAGLTREAENTLKNAFSELERLDAELANASAKVVTEPRPIRALVVEDNDNESALLAEYLRLHGIKVETAHDGQDALDYLRVHDRPDVILLDMRMPRCDGPTTIAAIRGNTAYAGMKVFAVSGADPSDYSLPSGDVDGWFTKPVDPVKLIGQMTMALDCTRRV